MALRNCDYTLTLIRKRRSCLLTQGAFHLKPAKPVSSAMPLLPLMASGSPAGDFGNVNKRCRVCRRCCRRGDVNGKHLKSLTIILMLRSHNRNYSSGFYMYIRTLISDVIGVLLIVIHFSNNYSFISLFCRKYIRVYMQMISNNFEIIIKYT